ncbi:MAG: AI-2E family transporter [Verrucomicrobiota bacterium]|jgi:predicted PurR-regulated permease PerM
MSSLPPPTPQQARIIWFALTALALGALGGVVAGVVWGLGRVLHLLAPVLWPLALGGVLAYLLDPLVDRLEALRVPRARAIGLVFASACALVAGVFLSFVPQVVGEARQFGERVPAYSLRLKGQLDAWATNPPAMVQRVLAARDLFVRQTNAPAGAAGSTGPDGSSGSTADGNARRPLAGGISPETLRSFTTWMGNLLPSVGGWIGDQVGRVTGWVGVLAGLCLVPIYAFYFLLEKRGIQMQWTEYLPVRTSWFKDELVFCLRAVNDYLIVFFRSQVLVALCDGLLYTTGFLVIGLPYAFLLGLLATALTMIPFIGAAVSCTTALVVAFGASGGWHLPVAVLAVYGVVQALEGLVISPKIMGDRVGLHPLTIIVAVMVGTQLLGGLLGGVLAIPATAALRVIMFRYVWKRRQTSEAAPASSAGNDAPPPPSPTPSGS